MIAIVPKTRQVLKKPQKGGVSCARTGLNRLAERPKRFDGSLYLLRKFIPTKERMILEVAGNLPLPAEESVRVVPLLGHIHVEAFQPPFFGPGRVQGAAETLQKRR